RCARSLAGTDAHVAIRAPPTAKNTSPTPSVIASGASETRRRERQAIAPRHTPTAPPAIASQPPTERPGAACAARTPAATQPAVSNAGRARQWIGRGGADAMGIGCVLNYRPHDAENITGARVVRRCGACTNWRAYRHPPRPASVASSPFSALAPVLSEP